MKRTVLTFVLLAGLLFPGGVRATLIDRGGGLIYDSDLNITILKDAFYAGQYFSWGGATAWASNLTYFDSVRNVTYSDWRLPNADPSCGFNWNCASSELGHLYYTELGNQANISPTNSGPFVSSWVYGFGWFFWNAQQFNAYYDGAYNFWWDYGYSSGHQSATGKGVDGLAWAVRDGDVAVSPIPEPETYALMLAGLGLLGFMGRRRKQKEAAAA